MLQRIGSTFKRLTPMLVGAMTIAAFSSIPAQSITPVSAPQCRGEISLRDGTRLSYLVSGSVNLNDGRQSKLNMTILRREQNGTQRTVRQAASLSYFEESAPDADYSRLPFTGAFKAKPNDGRGIYHLRSARHGLLIRFNPSQSAPQQAQVVHYLEQNQYSRSTAFSCTLKP